MSIRTPFFVSFVLATSTAQAAESTDVSFQKDLIPLLKRRCASCHITGDEPGNLSLIPKRAYASLVDAPSKESSLKRVTPGSPDESYLLHKLQGTQLEVGGAGSQMPFMAPALSKDQIARIRTWIVNGAENN